MARRVVLFSDSDGVGCTSMAALTADVLVDELDLTRAWLALNGRAIFHCSPKPSAFSITGLERQQIEKRTTSRTDE